MSQCCLSGFEWDGKPTGKETKLGKTDTYVTGSNKEASYPAKTMRLRLICTDIQHIRSL